MEIKRTILKDINEWLGNEKILILKGARQVGRTTILKFLQDTLTSQGKATKYNSVIFLPIGYF